MTDYFFRRGRPPRHEPVLRGGAGTWQRLFGLTDDEWAKELRRTSRRRRKPLTAFDKAREMLVDYGEAGDEEKVAALAAKLTADTVRAEAVNKAAEPFGPRAQLETLDWREFTAPKIVEALETYALTKGEKCRLLLLDGRFDTGAVVEAVRVSPAQVSNERTRLKRDFEAGRLTRPLPRSVTHARVESHKGVVRHDLRRVKKMPTPGKSARAYGDGKQAQKRKGEVQ